MIKEGVSIILVNEDFQVLAVSRKPDHQQWGFPGGKVDPGEIPTEAIRRELLEETGLSVWQVDLVYANCESDRMNYTYWGREYWGELKPEPGHILKWISWAELTRNSPFSDYNWRVMQSFLNFKDNERNNQR